MHIMLDLDVDAQKSPYPEYTYFYLAAEEAADEGYRTGTWLEGVWGGGWTIEGVIQDAELGDTYVQYYIPTYSLDQVVIVSRNVVFGHEYRLRGHYQYAHDMEPAQAGGPNGSFQDIASINFSVSSYVITIGN